MESLYFLIPLFFVVIFVLPLLISVKLSVNLHNKIGVVSVHLFRFRLVLMLFRYENNKIIIKTKKKKKEMEMELTDKQKRFAEQFIVQMKNKINVRSIMAYTRIGTNDAFANSLISGFFNSVFASVLGYVKNNKKNAKIDVISYPAYNQELFVVCVCGKISFSIFDLLYSLIMSFTIIKRSEKYEGV